MVAAVGKIAEEVQRLVEESSRERSAARGRSYLLFHLVQHVFDRAVLLAQSIGRMHVLPLDSIVPERALPVGDFSHRGVRL